MSMTTPEKATWAVVGVALAGVIALAVFARRGAKTPATETPEVESAGEAQEKTTELLYKPAGELGDFACVERSGRAMNTSELRGRFVVADLIFTSCAGTCPMLTQRMAELQIALAGKDDVRLVSFSVDPERDTSAALTEYADRYGADKDRWVFLSCDKPTVAEIAYDRLKLVKSREELIQHSDKFALLDREGRVRAYYSPLEDRRWIVKLLRDLDLLRREPAK
jgi:cytochrome oxidase Cu insertion factor (SCO1/SenC/PrrC family)